jgi:hypothetical protein
MSCVGCKLVNVVSYSMPGRASVCNGQNFNMALPQGETLMISYHINSKRAQTELKWLQQCVKTQAHHHLLMCSKQYNIAPLNMCTKAAAHMQRHTKTDRQTLKSIAPQLSSTRLCIIEKLVHASNQLSGGAQGKQKP